jgi:hypothetical protein
MYSKVCVALLLTPTFVLASTSFTAAVAIAVEIVYLYTQTNIVNSWSSKRIQKME